MMTHWRTLLCYILVTVGSMSCSDNSNTTSPTKKAENISANETKSAPKVDIFIARHGERVDILEINLPNNGKWKTDWVKLCFPEGKYVRFDTNMPVKLPNRTEYPDSYLTDTPLTNVGVLQANQTGVGFAEANVTVKFAYASPVLRSVETCNYILNGMGIRDKLKIRVEPALIEWLWVYKSLQPLPKFMSNDELIAAGYNIDESYVPTTSREDLKKLLNESSEDYYERSYNITKKFIATAEEQGGGNILIVGHAWTLDTCSRQLTGKAPRNATELVNINTPYVSVVRVVRDQEKGTWTLQETPARGLTITANKVFNHTELLP